MDVTNLREFEVLARERLDPASFAYYAGGSWDEVTLRENEAAFARRRLLPRVLVDVSAVDASTTLLGSRVALPIGIAPAALQGLAHPEGELVSGRAAARAHVLFCLSTFSNRSLETVASVGRGTRWFQLYVQRDRARTEALVARAAAAGYGALVVTVDLPVAGYRDRELRAPLTDEGELPNVGELGGADFLHGIGHQIDPSPDWDDVAWLRSLSELPVVLKGILDPADAARAVEAGAGRAELYLDGGVRRGTDAVTALALGARAVFIGRPVLYALAAGGEAGVARCLEILAEEMRTAMALLGAPTVAQLTRDRVL
ncbi:MAG: alpha-hydroxy acid oxidase [Candidatus Limnocylindrales bacterium]